MNNPLTNFLMELMTRLTTNNPKFFKVVQTIALVIGASSAVLMYLDGKVELPSWTIHIANIEVIINSVVAAVISQLPNAK